MTDLPKGAVTLTPNINCDERWDVKFINHRLIEVREPVIALSTNDRAWKNEARWTAKGFWNDVFLMPYIGMFETPDAEMRGHVEA